MGLQVFYKWINILILLISGCYSFAFCQDVPLKDELLKVTTLSDSRIRKIAGEKVYIQFDKPDYVLGDTVWFKGYLLNATDLTPSVTSGIINVDVVNNSSDLVKQYNFKVKEGLFEGNISLSNKDFTQGAFIIRAYTNWMRNQGNDCFFYKRFYLSSNDLNNKIANLNTDGSTGKSSGNNTKAAGKKKDKKAVVLPVSASAGNIDVQFLPEGGNLVAGLLGRIGFKAIGEEGKGINISGAIVDHDQNQIASFRSMHNGMGRVDMMIKDGETYSAKVTLPGGKTNVYPLPVVKTSGTTLQVKNLRNTDSLEVSIAATNNLLEKTNSFFLIGKVGGMVHYASVISFHEGNYGKKRIAKNLFPTGIASFTLMTIDGALLNERSIFVNHNDNLNISLHTDKPVYGIMDSIALKLKVTDNNGRPVAGAFSLSVTDNSLVNPDTLNQENILSRFLLTSDLKGYIENPGYYFSSNTNETWQALDDLLLTQGWVGYEGQQQAADSGKNVFSPETDFVVIGRTVNMFNKPLPGIKVSLFSKSPFILKTTFADKDGYFVFKDFPKVDTPVFILKAVDKDGKGLNGTITIAENMPPAFSAPLYPATTPGVARGDIINTKFDKGNVLAKETDISESGHLLKEVKITSRQIIKGSKNLNGSGNADQVIDEKELEKEGNKNLLQVFQEKIKGFIQGSKTWQNYSHLSTTDKWYFVKDEWVVVVIDGTELGSAIDVFPLELMRDYLQSVSASDIKGVEVNYSGNYRSAYELRFGALDPTQLIYAFIEVTTRAGNGPVIRNKPGMYLDRPVGISSTRQFYKPKYTVTDPDKYLPYLRLTIDWEPTIITNENGEATVSFYSAGKASKYTVIVEGTDLNGNLGYKAGKINIKN